MDIHVLFLIAGLFNFIHADGRLIQKNKTKTIEEVHSEKPNPVIRLTRDVTSESMDGLTKEESAQSDEFIQVYNRRARNFDEEPTALPKSYKAKRNSRSGTQRRDSKEKTSTTTTTKQPKQEVKAKTVKPLVIKPIPKFKEVDYEDFQSMLNNVHVIADSGDREDEDFNISDYDFDINHDEFTSTSMRKQFEPRVRTKNKANKKYEKKITLINVDDSVRKTKQTSNKKGRSVENSKQTDQSKDTDYYDDANDDTTKGQSKSSSRVTQDDQYSDENDDKEASKKNPHIRTSRSPDWS